MTMIYKNEEYELMELKEVKKNELYDIIVIFKVDHIDGISVYKYIDHFYGADSSIESIEDMAKVLIDIEEEEDNEN